MVSRIGFIVYHNVFTRLSDLSSGGLYVIIDDIYLKKKMYLPS